MSKKAKLILRKYGICFALVVAFAAAFMSAQDLENIQPVDLYRLLSDAFTVPGVLLVGIGGMVWLSGEGALNGLMYCLKSLKRLIPGKGADKMGTYADYVAERQGKKTGGYGFLIISGAVSLAISLVFLALFYSVYTV